MADTGGEGERRWIEQTEDEGREVLNLRQEVERRSVWFGHISEITQRWAGLQK
jgi:hypothetical protein